MHKIIISELLGVELKEVILPTGILTDPLVLSFHFYETHPPLPHHPYPVPAT